VERTTYLTVDRGRSIKTNEVKYHGYKGGHACQGINLRKLLMSPKGTRWKVSAKEAHYGTTDTYRPSVGLAPSDDIELVVKRCEEFPAGRRGGTT